MQNLNIPSSAPGYNRTVGQDCGEAGMSPLNMLHVLQLTLRCATVAAKVLRTPGHDGAVDTNRCKGVI